MVLSERSVVAIMHVITPAGRDEHLPTWLIGGIGLFFLTCVVLAIWSSIRMRRWRKQSETGGSPDSPKVVEGR